MAKLTYALTSRDEAELRRALDEEGASLHISIDAECDGVACRADVSFDSWDSLQRFANGDGREGESQPGYQAVATAYVWVLKAGEASARTGISRMEVEADGNFASLAKSMLDDALEAASLQLTQTESFKAQIETRELAESTPAASKRKGPPRFI